MNSRASVAANRSRERRVASRVDGESSGRSATKVDGESSARSATKVDGESYALTP